MNHPNVLLIGIDSLRADAIFGSHVQTPNLDAVCREGASFRQCISTGTLTTPSFAAILTGSFPPRNGIRALRHNRLSPDVSTLAETLGANGYTTVAKPTGPLLPATGIFRGFAQVDFRDGYKAPFFGWRDPLLRELTQLNRPWFVFLHTFEVHLPYKSPPDFREGSNRASYEKAVHAHDDWLAPLLDMGGAETIVVVTGDHGETFPEAASEQVTATAARFVRRRLHTRRWWPALDRWILPHTHGHGYALTEDLLRVPLLIRGANVPAVRVDEQVRHVDIAPTILDLCGIGRPPSMNGRSLMPLLHGHDLNPEVAYAEVGVSGGRSGTIAVRGGGYKLIKRRGELCLLNVADAYPFDGVSRADRLPNLIDSHPDIAEALHIEMEQVLADRTQPASGMTEAEEAEVERHLRTLGYL